MPFPPHSYSCPEKLDISMDVQLALPRLYMWGVSVIKGAILCTTPNFSLKMMMKADPALFWGEKIRVS